MLIEVLVARRALLVLALGAVACSSSAPPQPAAAPKSQTDLERYLPLAHDTVYSYETYTEGTGERGVLVLRVRRPRDDLAELDVAGRIQRLYLTRTGLKLATGGYLLVAPLRQNSEWQGDFGKVRVTSLAKASAVPAGRFENCLETVEEYVTKDMSKRTTTVFCPDVGIVSRETEAQVGNEYARESLKLKSYGPAFGVDPQPD